MSERLLFSRTNRRNGRTGSQHASESQAPVEFHRDVLLVFTVGGNAGDINQVLLNLVVNAAQAIGEVVGASGARGSIHIRTWQDRDDVLISVADNGTGIPDRIAGRVFDPFFTTKGVGRGTGQGLAISRTIVVERHGGSLTFETEPGKGTIFVVRLPARAAVSAPDQAAAA